MTLVTRTFSLRTLAKWPAVVLVLLAFLMTAGLTAVLPLPSTPRRRVRIRTTWFFSRLALLLFGVNVHKKHGERLQQNRRGLLIVANHVSYIDILVLSSLLPASFITSVELRNTPLLGLLARLGGTLFVERRSRAFLKQEIDQIAGVLARRCPVVLFPEGTTSNGEQVRQFRKSLFDAALSAGADVLPLCLKYTGINGRPITGENRDHLFYHGGALFRDHFPRFLSLKSVDVNVLPLKRLSVHRNTDRKELAGKAQQLISEAYHS